jgi:hypothetical protein
MPQCNNPLFPQENLKDPEPSGDKLQIYPQGIYDDFPKDGVTVVFGPDLKQRISVAIGNNCHTDLTSCRERLMPILQNTDLHTHTKRFILITAFVIGDVVASVSYLLSVAAAAAAGAGTGAWLASEVPAVRLSYSDLAQIHDSGKANKIAIQQGTDATPTTIVVPAMSEAPTPTGPDFITMETITADSDIAKKGDIVYHIPTDAARRIQDFLAMFGVKSLVDSCEGHDLFNPQKSRVRRGKRANTIEECLRQLNNFNADWIEAVPQNALQLAPQNFPNQPGPGQAVDFPVQGTMVDGVQVVVTTYHVMMQHRRIVQAAPVPVQGLDLNVLAVAAVGLTILTHAIMFAGQVGLKVVLPQSAISRDIRDDDFSCPKDILCINDACGAQKSGSEIAQRNAYCTKVCYPDCPIYVSEANLSCSRKTRAASAKALRIPITSSSRETTWTNNTSGWRSSSKRATTQKSSSSPSAVAICSKPRPCRRCSKSTVFHYNSRHSQLTSIAKSKKCARTTRTSARTQTPAGQKEINPGQKQKGNLVFHGVSFSKRPIRTSKRLVRSIARRSSWLLQIAKTVSFHAFMCPCCEKLC